MKIPHGVFTPKGEKAEGTVLLRGTDGKSLREYGTVMDGSCMTCMVLTAPSDVITASFVLNPGVADHVDFVIDGIRRDSCSSSASDKHFNRYFRRACYQGRKINRYRAGLKSCALEVQERETDEGERDSSPANHSLCV